MRRRSWSIEIHQSEAGCVPDLVGKVAIAFDAFFCQFEIPAGRCHRGERKAQGIGAELIHHMQGINDVAFGLAHLLALSVPHERMDVDIAEGYVVHKSEAEHDHAGDPKEQDVEPGDERRSRVVGL